MKRLTALFAAALMAATALIAAPAAGPDSTQPVAEAWVEPTGCWLQLWGQRLNGGANAGCDFLGSYEYVRVKVRCKTGGLQNHYYWTWGPWVRAAPTSTKFCHTGDSRMYSVRQGKVLETGNNVVLEWRFG